MRRLRRAACGGFERRGTEIAPERAYRIAYPLESSENGAGLMLLLAQPLRDEIEQHGRESYPRECCGFIVGSCGPPRTATRVQRLVNQCPPDVRDRFEIDPLDWLRVERTLESGEQVIGVYHSHPDDSAAPSPRDHAQAQPGLSYVIVAVHTRGVGPLCSWMLQPDSHGFARERLVAS